MKDIPKIGLGTYKNLGEQCYRTVRTALDLGYQHFDTAQIYENEEFVGKALKGSGISREKYRLTTKLWLDNYDEKFLKKSVEESLRKLETDFVDLLLMHWPDKKNNYENHKSVLESMLKLKEEGKVKNIGVSNFTVDLLDEAVKFTGGQIYTNQVEYHVNLNQDKLLDFCAEKNIVLTAYAPFGHGNVFVSVELEKIALKYGKTVAQIVLNWLVRQDGVVTIPKAVSEEHLKNNLEIFDFELAEDDLKIIDGLPKYYRYFDFDGLRPERD